jgi:pyridoxine 5-phosphate synthase
MMPFLTAADDEPLLGVNIDHVATLRNARRGRFPDPVTAALAAVEAGADIITFHLREDRRHILDDDVHRLKAAVHAPLNFEAAVTDEMVGLIERVRPEHVCFVPERRQELTTEGGLDVAGHLPRVRQACERVAAVGARVSLFIAPQPEQIEAAAQAGAPCVEFHTGALAEAWWAGEAARLTSELDALRAGLARARALGLRTHAGHGLALWPAGETPQPPGAPSSTAVVAALPEVAELHIGHALVGHALMVGLARAVQDFKAEMRRARRPEAVRGRP